MRIVAAILAIFVAALVWTWRRDAARLTEQTVEIERLRAAEAKLRAVPMAPPAVVAEQPSSIREQPIERVRERTVLREDWATRNELLKLVDEKQARLNATQRSLAEAEERVQEMEAKLAALAVEQKRFAEVELELKDRLDTSVRLVGALEAEVKGRSDRMLRIESTNRELLVKVEENSRRMERLRKAAGEMEELSRRRDVPMNNILRRYREVTDQYRSLAVRGGDLPAGVDLSRIQSAIMLAEEDLRHLQTLGAQASRLQKEFQAAGR